MFFLFRVTGYFLYRCLYSCKMHEYTTHVNGYSFRLSCESLAFGVLFQNTSFACTMLTVSAKKISFDCKKRESTLTTANFKSKFHFNASFACKSVLNRNGFIKLCLQNDFIWCQNCYKQLYETVTAVIFRPWKHLRKDRSNFPSSWKLIYCGFKPWKIKKSVLSKNFSSFNGTL